MGLSHLQVERFRAFGLKARLDVCPVTLVFGYNSDGKSALVRALPLLAASLGRDTPNILDLRSPAVRGATFEELFSSYGRSPTMNFELGWDDDESPVTRIEIALRSGGVGKSEIVESVRCFDRANVPLLAFVAKYTEEPGDEGAPYEVTLGAAAVGDLRVNFRGLIPSLATKTLEPTVTQRLVVVVDQLRQRLLSLFDSIYWLAAVRALPKRRGELRGRPPKIGHDGAYAAEHLAFESKRDQAVLNVVNAFFRDVTGHELFIEEAPSGGTAGFVLRLARCSPPGVRVNLLDTGEGMAQVLPVAVLAALAKCGRLGRSPVILLEHPESDLHPSAHEQVAAFLCQIAASSDARFIIETHSENFLSRVQLAVLKGEISADKVGVNWIWRHEDGAAVRPIRMDVFAALRGWPVGVFAEDTALHREILDARRVLMREQEKE